MAKLPAEIKTAAALIGHKSLSAHVYSHPKAGIGADLCWGVWEGSRSVATVPQVSYSQDTALKDWREALDILERLILAARHQLELVDDEDE
jgi:hypothetical protein